MTLSWYRDALESNLQWQLSRCCFPSITWSARAGVPTGTDSSQGGAGAGLVDRKAAAENDVTRAARNAAGHVEASARAAAAATAVPAAQVPSSCTCSEGTELGGQR